MNRTRVEIDLNSLRPDGSTRARLSRVDGPITEGQMVTAFESEDGVAAHAMVARIDERAGYAFLIVNRDSMQDDDGSLNRASITYAANRATARVANERAQRTTTSAAAQYALRASRSI